MKKRQDFKLVKGVFTPRDAREVLMDLYSSKVNFHLMKNFSSNERLGKDDKTAMKRIPELKKSIAKISEIIAKASDLKQRLSVTAVVTIEPAGKKE